MEEDKLSQIFIKKQHELEEQPSSKVWERIERRLDLHAMPQKKEGRPFQLSFMYIAASVVVLFSIGYFAFWKSNEEGMIAKNTSKTEDKITDFSNDEQFYFQIDSAQKQLIAEVNPSLGKNLEKPLSSDREVDEPLSSVIFLASEKEEPLKESGNKNLSYPSASLQLERKSEYNLPSAMNYASPPSLQFSEDVISEKGSVALLEEKSAVTAPVFKKKALSPNAQEQKLCEPLQKFHWILGQWIDKEEEGGQSTEQWVISDFNTLVCVGMKVKSKAKIFEDKTFLYFDAALNQVFLKITLDDSRKQVLYQLTNQDSDRLYFVQDSDATYPQKIIFQRDLKGYTVITLNEKGFISTNVQSYLEHRNRVSQVRAIRKFVPYKK
jgi:hypothetical protein